jgi:hypothetical protein
MLVPEAAMNKYYLPLFGEHQVGLAWKFGAVQPIVVSHSEQCPPNNELRQYLFHVSVACFRYDVLGL